jgi:hypothetical protein
MLSAPVGLGDVESLVRSAERGQNRRRVHRVPRRTRCRRGSWPAPQLGRRHNSLTLCDQCGGIHR